MYSSRCTPPVGAIRWRLTKESENCHLVPHMALSLSLSPKLTDWIVLLKATVADQLNYPSSTWGRLSGEKTGTCTLKSFRISLQQLTCLTAFTDFNNVNKRYIMDALMVISVNYGLGLWKGCAVSRQKKRDKDGKIINTLVGENWKYNQVAFVFGKSKTDYWRYAFAGHLTLKEKHATSFPLISFYLIIIITVIKRDSSGWLALTLRAVLGERWWRRCRCSVVNERKMHIKKNIYI